MAQQAILCWNPLVCGVIMSIDWSNMHVVAIRRLLWVVGSKASGEAAHHVVNQKQGNAAGCSLMLLEPVISENVAESVLCLREL